MYTRVYDQTFSNHDGCDVVFAECTGRASGVNTCKPGEAKRSAATCGGRQAVLQHSSTTTFDSITFHPRAEDDLSFFPYTQAPFDPSRLPLDP